MRRIRITTRNFDGSRSDEPPLPSEPGKGWPNPRGKNLCVNIVNDDGTLTPLPGVKAVSIRCDGRAEPVLATITVFAEVARSYVDAGNHLGRVRNLSPEDIERERAEGVKAP